jgi:hypothetical protein
MSAASDLRTIAIVTACMKDETPTFARNELAVTQEEVENGAHFFLAEMKLREDGYEEPFVHFAADEGPAFLHDAVLQFLDMAATVTEPTPHVV